MIPIDTFARYTPIPVLIAILALATPAFAQSDGAGADLLGLDDAETGALLLRTTEPGRYLAAPAVDTHVAMEITGMVARVQVSQRFTNPGDAWVEGVYVFPLPDDSAVDRLRMQIGDRYKSRSGIRTAGQGASASWALLPVSRSPTAQPRCGSGGTNRRRITLGLT